MTQACPPKVAVMTGVTSQAGLGWCARVGLKAGIRMAYEHAPFRPCA